MPFVIAQIGLSVEQAGIVVAIITPIVFVIAWLIRLEQRANQSATREDFAKLKGEMGVHAASTKGSLETLVAQHTGLQSGMARVEIDNKNSNQRVELRMAAFETKMDAILIAAAGGTDRRSLRDGAHS